MFVDGRPAGVTRLQFTRTGRKIPGTPESATEQIHQPASRKPYIPKYPGTGNPHGTGDGSRNEVRPLPAKSAAGQNLGNMSDPPGFITGGPTSS